MEEAISKRTTRPPAPAIGAATALIALLAAGCTEESGQAQDAATLPADREVISQRADQARVKGGEDAPLRIVEVSDFQCPFCAQYFQQTFPVLDSLYIQPGKVSYVWISFPNPSHARAWPSIEAAFCAGAVGKFWPMHDLLFERQQEWTEAEDPFASFVSYAEELGIDAPTFSNCMRNDQVAPLMVRDYQNVVRSGINSTPFFILADSVAIRGAAPADSFRTVIDTLLARQAATGAGGGGARGMGGTPAGDAGGADTADGASGADTAGGG